VVDATGPAQGDLVFCHGKGFISWAIRFAERIRFRRGTKFNHVAVLVGPVGEDWRVIEALGSGVKYGLLSELMASGPVQIVSPPSMCSRLQILRFMQAQEGSKYGFLTIVSTALSLILPGSITFFAPGTWICSAVVGEALRFAGWLHNWPDIYQVSPAQLYAAVVNG
jgi:hypothetical protein